MKFRFYNLYFLLLWSTALPSQSLFDPLKIQEIKIYFPYSNWDQKLDSLRAANSDARLIAHKVILNGVAYDSVGIRYKGNSSYNASRPKNPFNVKLDYIKEDQKYDGYNTLKLSSGFMDPSFLREVIGYQIARQYLPAPKANFINVYVNDLLIGLFTNVEDVDNLFLSNHFFDSDGPFFQCDRIDKQIQLPGTCPPGMVGSALKFLSNDSICYYNNYEIESDYGWKELLKCMQTLNQNINQIGSVLDVDRSLWMLALNNFYVNLDSYSGSGHNYLVYQNQTGRFHTIPWDYNEFYGAFTNAGTGMSLNVSQMEQLDPLLHINNPERPLISKLLSIPVHKKRYLAHLFTIMNEAMASNAYESEGLKYQNLIATSVANDRNKFFSEAAFQTNLYSNFALSGGMAKTYPGLVSLTQARVKFLSEHSTLKVVKPVITEVQSTPQIVLFDGEVDITARVENALSVSLFYRYDKTEIFKEIKMFDDGMHQDGMAGDGIYGITVSMNHHLELQYYIFAENESIASLSPPRAEYEFHHILAKAPKLEPGIIILNEIMPSNTNYIQDESGDFDDWIELYNTSTEEVSCLGLYLSDKLDNRLKWTFPDTSIPPQSYIIVWADEDGKDPGLHANFKLSKSGETLTLCNRDSSLLDSISFSALMDNQSIIKCPSDWIKTSTPTFNKKNICEVSNIEYEESEFRLYPNPFKNVISISSYKTAIREILITDLSGRSIFVKKLSSNNRECEIETGSWDNGIYFIHLKIPDEHKVYKLVKCER